VITPHHVGMENNPAIRHLNWMGDSFPDLTCTDHLWAEAIHTSCLWNKWGPSGKIRDVPFLRLLAMGVWDGNEGTRHSYAEIKSMRHSAAISGCLIIRALEEEDKVSSLQVILDWTPANLLRTTERGSGVRVVTVPAHVEHIH